MRKKIVSLMLVMFVMMLFLPVNVWATNTDVAITDMTSADDTATTTPDTEEAITDVEETSPDAEEAITDVEETSPDTEEAITDVEETSPDTIADIEEAPIVETSNTDETPIVDTPDTTTTTTDEEATTPMTQADETTLVTPFASTANARYSVLVLDTSGSMRGSNTGSTTPIELQKQAAIKFCDYLLSDTSADNYIAVVEFNSNVKKIDFTTDIDAVKDAINSTIAYGSTNTAYALKTAEELFANVTDATIKNIVLCSDGLPDSESSALSQAQALHNDYFIYSLAFLHSDNQKAAAFMNDAQNAGYYEVNAANLDQLNFAFGQLGSDITNSNSQSLAQELYNQYKTISIACPVDVSVFEPSGKQIAHLKADGNVKIDTRYENYFSVTPIGNNDYRKNVKIPDGKDYKVRLLGTGEGTMEITIERNDGINLTTKRYTNVPVSSGMTGYFDFGSAYTAVGDLYLNNKLYTASSTTTSSAIKPVPTPSNKVITNLRKEHLSNSYTRYDVNLSQSNGGEVKANSTRITPGSLVKITVIPDYGYKLDTITVKAADGTTIQVERQKDGSYGFTMPKMNVDVKTTFKLK